MSDKREPVFWPWFISLVSCTVVVGYFLAHGDHVTAFAVVVLVLAALSGYCMTASRLLCLDAAFVVAALLTSILIQFCRAAITQWLGTSGFLLSVFVMGLITVLATDAALRWAIVKYCSARPSLKALNQWAGFAIAATQGAVLCGLVLGALLVLEPLARERLFNDARSRDHKAPQVIAQKVVAYARQTRKSAIGPTVAHCNPLQLLPSLKELHDDLLGLNPSPKRTQFSSESMIDDRLSAR